MRNQLANTTRSVTDLSNTRGELEKSAGTSANEIEELEAKLSEARVKHEAETKAVADLRVRVSEQKARLQRLNEDVIAAESDLSGMRSEKDELGQGLLRDKEEVRGLQARMKEIEDGKTGLKLLLEKLKKEARQQKGMATIAKKQLSTAEGSRDSIQREIKEEEEAAKEPAPVSSRESPEPTGPLSPTTLTTPAGVPLPGTPRALSPTPTGMSQRSKNPFDLLARGSQSRATAPPASTPPATSPAFGTTAIVGAGAVVGAAASAVAAGAETLYNAAKDVVSSDPEAKPAETKSVTETDPFGSTGLGQQSTEGRDNDPFGVPATSGTKQSGFESEFDSGFGDSSSSGPINAIAPTEDLHMAPASEPVPPASDFDSAFAGFNDANAGQPDINVASIGGIPSGIPKSAIPVSLRPEAERSTSTQAMAPSSIPHTPVSEAPPSIESRDSLTARAGEPVLTANTHVDDPVSSEEEDEPEDLEAPRNGYKGTGRAFEEPDREPMGAMTLPSQPNAAGIAPGLPMFSPALNNPSEDGLSSMRRSAPPPPSSRSASTVAPTAALADDFDPFGAPVASPSNNYPEASTLPISAPKAGRFDDDDDFDFSDLPPAQVEQGSGVQQRIGQTAPSAFDDEFAGFDDDFEKPSSQPNSGSDNSTSITKSYEMVSPQPTQQPFGGQSSDMLPPKPRTYEGWGLGGAIGQPVPAQPAVQPSSGRGFSFDDAFRGEFEPT